MAIAPKVVFKLGRAPTCHVIINQNTISRIQCCLIWWPKSNRWSIIDGDIDAPLLSSQSQGEEHKTSQLQY